jgi:hypothetical protein
MPVECCFRARGNLLLEANELAYSVRPFTAWRRTLRDADSAAGNCTNVPPLVCDLLPALLPYTGTRALSPGVQQPLHDADCVTAAES